MQYLVDLGLFDERAGCRILHKNIVTRVVGTDKLSSRIHLQYRYPKEIKYCFLDGLSNYLDRTELRDTVLSPGITTEGGQRLIRLANEKGGGDKSLLC